MLRPLDKCKRLVLTFDAFGSLFTPKEPIAKTYAKVGNRYGLSVREDEIASSFKNGMASHVSRSKNWW